MAKQIINTGAAANDGTGDTLRQAGTKLNANFTELYDFLGNAGQLSLAAHFDSNGVVFEGATANDFETSLRVVDPTADRTVTIPNASGNIVLDAATQTLTNKTLTSAVLTTPQFNDTSADHQYVVAVSELTADRTVTLPLLTTNDEFVFKDHTQTLTNKTLTSPTINTARIGTGLNDTNGNELVDVIATTNAVNHVRLTNNVASSAPKIEAVGGDANINFEIGGKGTGGVKVTSKAIMAEEVLSASGAISLNVPLTVFNNASALAMTLADGTNIGEIKYFINKNTGTATITPTNLAGASTVAFTTNQAGFMLWSGTEWHLASKTAAS